MKSVLLIFLLLIFLLDPDNYLHESQDAIEHDDNNTEHDEDCEESDEDCEESDEDCEDCEESDEDCEDCDCCPMCYRCCFYAGRVGCKTKHYRISCLIKDLPTVTEKPPTVDLKLDIHSSIGQHQVPGNKDTGVKHVHQVSHDPYLRPSHLQPPNSASSFPDFGLSPSPLDASSANSKSYSGNQQGQL